MRATVYLRRRNVLKAHGWAGTLEQLWVNDDQTEWEWREVPLVNNNDVVMKGEGPPPVSGTNEESSNE